MNDKLENNIDFIDPYEMNQFIESLEESIVLEVNSENLEHLEEIIGLSASSDNLEDITEQSRSGRSSFSPEQDYVADIISRAMREPQGSSAFADLIRGSYSIPGTDDEIVPLKPEDLTVKSMYFQILGQTIRAAVLATNPSAQVLSMLRLAIDTPPPSSATELISRIAAIWGTAAKDIIDDTLIRGYRAADYMLNDIIAPMTIPGVAAVASSLITSAVVGDYYETSSNVTTIGRDPQAAVEFFGGNREIIKLIGELDRVQDENQFVNILSRIFEFLNDFNNAYEQGYSVWSGFFDEGDGGIDENHFQNLFLDAWNTTVGDFDEKLEIESFDDFGDILGTLRRDDYNISPELMNVISLSFRSISIDQNNLVTMIAGTSNDIKFSIREMQPIRISSIPLVFIEQGTAYISRINKNPIVSSSSFLGAVNNMYNTEKLHEIWGEIIKSRSCFEKTFIEKLPQVRDSILSTDSVLRDMFLRQAAIIAGEIKDRSGYTEDYVDDYVKLVESALSGRPVSVQNLVDKYDENVNQDIISDQAEKFLQGNLGYYDVATEAAYNGAPRDQKLTPFVKEIVVEVCKNKILQTTMEDLFVAIASKDKTAVFYLAKLIRDTKNSIYSTVSARYISAGYQSDLKIQVPEGMNDDQKYQFKRFKFLGIRAEGDDNRVSSSEEFIKIIDPIISGAIGHNMIELLENSTSSLVRYRGADAAKAFKDILDLRQQLSSIKQEPPPTAKKDKKEEPQKSELEDDILTGEKPDQDKLRSEGWTVKSGKRLVFYKTPNEEKIYILPKLNHDFLYKTAKTLPDFLFNIPPDGESNNRYKCISPVVIHNADQEVNFGKINNMDYIKSIQDKITKGDVVLSPKKTRKKRETKKKQDQSPVNPTLPLDQQASAAVTEPAQSQNNTQAASDENPKQDSKEVNNSDEQNFVKMLESGDPKSIDPLTKDYGWKSFDVSSNIVLLISDSSEYGYFLLKNDVVERLFSNEQDFSIVLFNPSDVYIENNIRCTKSAKVLKQNLGIGNQSYKDPSFLSSAGVDKGFLVSEVSAKEPKQSEKPNIDKKEKDEESINSEPAVTIIPPEAERPTEKTPHKKQQDPKALSLLKEIEISNNRFKITEQLKDQFGFELSKLTKNFNILYHPNGGYNSYIIPIYDWIYIDADELSLLRTIASNIDDEEDEYVTEHPIYFSNIPRLSNDSAEIDAELIDAMKEDFDIISGIPGFRAGSVRIDHERTKNKDLEREIIKQREKEEMITLNGKSS